MEINDSLDKDSRNSVEEYLRILFKYKKLILYFTGSALLISILLFFFVFKPVYYSTSTIKSSSKIGGMADLLAGGLPDIGDLGDITSGGASSKELALYENILLSRRCIEETIIKFNLLEEYDQEYMFFAVKMFRNDVVTISMDKIAGTMEVGIYDENPERAKEISDFMLFQLNKINTELSVLSAKNNRVFLQKRYELVKQDLKKAEDSLKVFQQINGIAPDITVQASLKTEVELEAQIASEEVKLDLLRKILSPDQSEIKAQEEKIEALKKQVSQIKTSTGDESILGLKGKPDIVMNFLRLKRDVEIQNKILSIILPLYEQAKIEENRDTPSILVIDPPNIPDYKAKPKRLPGVIFSTGVAFVLICLSVIFWEKFLIFKKRIKLH